MIKAVIVHKLLNDAPAVHASDHHVSCRLRIDSLRIRHLLDVTDHSIKRHSQVFSCVTSSRRYPNIIVVLLNLRSYLVNNRIDHVESIARLVVVVAPEFGLPLTIALVQEQMGLSDTLTVVLISLLTLIKQIYNVLML